MNLTERNRSTGESSWNVDVELLKGIGSFTAVSRMKRPNEELRRQRERRPPPMEEYRKKFKDSVVAPWYKKGGQKLVLKQLISVYVSASCYVIEILIISLLLDLLCGHC